ncbi:MAG TPA: hypothetical protein VEA39_02625 [Methylophilaceae bacterium]|nr:hypothetical protein [Methylophilaceae bacterium]
MTIRKRTALLFGIVGFMSGFLFAQYQRKRLNEPLRNHSNNIRALEKPLPQVPMQVVDQTIARARKQRKKSDHTMH